MADSKVYKAENYVLATGVDSYRIGKQVGITLPVYPMRGNLVTIPINVRNFFENDINKFLCL